MVDLSVYTNHRLEVGDMYYNTTDIKNLRRIYLLRKTLYEISVLIITDRYKNITLNLIVTAPELSRRQIKY